MRPVCILFSSIILFLFVSCEVKIPENIIPPDKMEAFLYDYHLVQAMSGEYASDEYKEKLYYSYIFKKHNIEKAQFDVAMKWYNRYPKHLKRIYENLAQRLDAEVEKLNDARVCREEGVTLDMAYLGGDRVNLWASSRIKQMSSNSLNNRILFSFDVPDDTTFVKGDSLSFSFNADFLSPEYVSQNAYASIRLDYNDGAMYTKSVRVDSAGWFNLSAPRYHDSKLKSMCGFVYYFDNDTTSGSRMLLSDISVYRIHPPQKKK